MRPVCSALSTSIKLIGTSVAGAEDRQRLIPGFDQEKYSRTSVVCVGAGGLISHIAPTLCRKGIEKLKVLDRDIVEASNLNRQRFYAKDIGKNKAIALAKNLQHECIAGTEIRSYAMTLEQAIQRRVDLRCDVAVCGIDNNPGRVLASRFFRQLSIPVVFCAVSRDGDLGYVFVQEKDGACLGCLYPDITDDDRFPGPGTPAIADILQVVGELAVYSSDTLITMRARNWNYRRLSLFDQNADGSMNVRVRSQCRATSH